MLRPHKKLRNFGVKARVLFTRVFSQEYFIIRVYINLIMTGACYWSRIKNAPRVEVKNETINLLA